jgi:hypothetical protein
MAHPEISDFPYAGFDYNYWFICTTCTGRVEISGNGYEAQCTKGAALTRCGCGTEVDITRCSPVQRDNDDIAGRDVEVDKRYWYHSSRYADWPDLAAYGADVRAAYANSHPMVNVERVLREKMSLALHLGTYASATENMLRRLGKQDVGDAARTRYWLHRVEISLSPGELDPRVGEEFATLMGDVPLSELRARGCRAVRYINLYEAAGSLSLAIDPGIIAAVSTIAVPVAALGAEATGTAREAAVLATNALAQNATRRPDTTGLDIRDLRIARFFKEPRDPSDPESVRLFTVGEQLREYDARWREIRSVLDETFVAQYLPTVNERVRRRFLDAMSAWDDPQDYHLRFRMMAGLLHRGAEVVEQFSTAPRRIVRTRAD